MTHLRTDTVPLSDAELAAGYSNGTGECIMPVPSNAGTPPPSLTRIAGRKADCRFNYRDRDGGLIGHVLRWDAAGNFRKEFRPVTYWRNTNGGEWRARIWPGLRPLYGLDKLAARPNAIVLVVEGEKTADAVDSGPLAHMLRWGDSDLIAVTWPGGTNAVGYADFSPLAARDVIIMPDADTPGERAADALVPLLRKAGVGRLRRWKAPVEAKEAWDIADETPPGITPEELVKSILDAPEIAPPPPVIVRLEDWLTRDLPDPDFLMGHWLTTTSRVLFAAPTGLGKSMFWTALGMAASASMPFLRWQGQRPFKLLYVDGEMARRLMKTRLVDEVERLGVVPAGFHVLNHDDVEDFAPLNTPEGQKTIEAFIARIGGVDFIIFDNIMSLISGDMKEEQGWRETIPWQHSLTRRNIGQAWLHHTGHDEQKSYGSKVKEWQVDTFMFAEKVERPDADISFRIEFRKARERTPATHDEFEIIDVALVDNVWTWSGAEGAVAQKRPSAISAKFLAALVNVLAGDNVTIRSGRRCCTMDSWRRECELLGLIDRNAKPDSARALFARHRRELVAANLVACNDELAWKL